MPLPIAPVVPRRRWPVALVLAALTGLGAPSALPAQPLPAQPLPAKPASRQAGVAAHAMVVAANPLAVQAGLQVLRAGGTAVDAAVAVQAVLGLVEPQSSGLGGGAFMVHYDAKTRKVTAYDGREVAPKGADPRQFYGPDGRLMTYPVAVTGGISTGVPGAVAMLEMAQKDHGHLPWRSLFVPARQLAMEGFIVSPRLAGMIASGAPQAQGADATAYFTKPDGTRYQAGDRLINRAYGQTLDRIALKGAAGILTGPVAERIVARLRQGPNPSSMTLADLATYQPRRTEALCRPYRRHVICSPQAPSGGVVVQQGLGILAHTAIDHSGPADPQGWYLLAQASRLAYADRDRYEGDPAFVRFPAGLLANDYLKARAGLIGPMATPVTYGTPADAPCPGAACPAPDATREPGGTSHFAIVDTQGNAVSMTSTVESLFGSGRMVDGFFLNNQLTDFSWAPVAQDGTPAANALAPGKRPRSSMSPLIILTPDGQLAGAVGSPGGSSIIAYVLKATVAMLDWKMAPQDAVALPNLVANGDRYGADAFAPDIAAALAARGMPLQSGRGENSGLHAFVVRRGPGGERQYVGGADPRREGLARGF
ncbi:gamma-glutamyltransferase [Novosphingobium sp. FSY-8]|uniref:Gamma-glutamyltransferase n=1 Tax=Novosphingobium ovatum TaxID=1908523 RepID=A0ABW9XAF1_9SPHN|nr:gamma-glutamyltransferase family protein [Novosphingobium ovatum]NBC35475.1 gamma-glutamyltransferase [Novosphingobium ovatum]